MQEFINTFHSHLYSDAVSNMESVLSSSSAWSAKYKDVGSVDDTRIPECAEGFMTLLSVITGMVKT